MAGVNKVILLGNLGGDPEIRYTQSGKAVCNVSLATNEKRKQGEDYVDVVEWHRLVFWSRLAEVIGKYAFKGKQIYVEGKLRTRKYEDRGGVTRKSTEIFVDSLQLLGSKDDGRRGDEGERRESDYAPEEEKENGNDLFEYRDEDDDLPF